ncbi:hypothetical protein BVC80_6729g4 [Macleaya cordata]|uniref:Uncharacterized protein n=1 Tax=Macleaya cordata TaxID=56857 RepID=A0A200Q843_MACCD|nr:hypothetical protein BVC80_6729g2 [Macleaya cordata]OVA06594.1 hypothetical protein BVC80_6729g4 [Macleaya cordata]
MSSNQNFYGFPYFSPPPHYFPLPPKVTAPPPKPPTPAVSAPPPKPLTSAVSAPPPPRHSIPPSSPIVKPPPRPVAPPPHIVPPSPAPSNHTTIIIVFVSLGGLLFLAFLSVALCCFMKRKKKMVQETEIINIDEHMKFQEAIVPGPHGKQAVLLSIEEDVHIQEAIKKNERVGEGLNTKSVESNEGLHGKKSAESVL